MLTFKATYEHKAEINYRNKFGKYLPKKVSVVRLDPDNPDDITAIKTISETWKADKNIAKDIAEDMQLYPRQKHIFKDKYFYAITTQAKTFLHLNPEKVLGIAELTEKNEGFNYIDFIQVNPAYTNNTINRQFKHIGEALIKTLINAANCSKIYLNSLPHAVKFYLKQGFVMKVADISDPLMLLVKTIKK